MSKTAINIDGIVLTDDVKLALIDMQEDDNNYINYLVNHLDRVDALVFEVSQTLKNDFPSDSLLSLLNDNHNLKQHLNLLKSPTTRNNTIAQ